MLTGKTAFVDLSHGEVCVEDTPAALVEGLLGGRGLNMAYLHQSSVAEADPLGPGNVLVFGAGLLTGYPVPNSGRMSLSARSPESLALGDANMGGFFPTQMRRSGFDRLVISGRAAHPVYLYLEAGRLEIRDARPYWGLNVPQTQEALQRDLGRGVRSGRPASSSAGPRGS